MIKAVIITPWIGNGTEENSNRPQVGDDYGISKWEDVTGQPSENLPLAENMYIVKLEAENAVLDAIEADDTYLVLWSEEIVNEIPE